MTLIVILGQGQQLTVLEEAAPAAQLVQQINDGRWSPKPSRKKPLSPNYLSEPEHFYTACQVGEYVVVTDSTSDNDNALLPPAKPVRVSPREYQVLVGLVNGATFQQIASQLNIAERTVRAYVSGLKTRFHAQSVGQLIGRAFLSGIIKSETNLKSK